MALDGYFACAHNRKVAVISREGEPDSLQHDLNLLFGVLAVQLQKLTSSQLVEAAAAWATDPSQDLPHRLVERGFLSERDRDLISALVEKAVAVHGGEIEATLSSLGGDEALQHSFGDALTIDEVGRRSVRTDAQRTESVSGYLEGDLEDINAVEESPNRYSLHREHGRGGMGRVLTVRDEYLGRTIAFKELLIPVDAKGQSPVPTPIGSSIPLISRFIQEARITGQLEHPSIVPVYELGPAQRRHALLHHEAGAREDPGAGAPRGRRPARTGSRCCPTSSTSARPSPTPTAAA